MIKTIGPFIITVILLAACDALGVAPPASYFVATVEGAFEHEYVGGGTFSFGTRPTGQRTFLIYSRGEGSHAGHTFWIRNYDGGQLRSGSYPLQLVPGDVGDREARGIGAQYRRSGESEEFFVATSGELIITRSTSKIVEGRFAFTGFRYCSGEGHVQMDSAAGEPCTIPAEPPAEAPRIAIVGSFRTVPADTELRPDTP